MENFVSAEEKSKTELIKWRGGALIQWMLYGDPECRFTVVLNTDPSSWITLCRSFGLLFHKFLWALEFCFSESLKRLNDILFWSVAS